MNTERGQGSEANANREKQVSIGHTNPKENCLGNPYKVGVNTEGLMPQANGASERGWHAGKENDPCVVEEATEAGSLADREPSRRRTKGREESGHQSAGLECEMVEVEAVLRAEHENHEPPRKTPPGGVAAELPETGENTEG